MLSTRTRGIALGLYILLVTTSAFLNRLLPPITTCAPLRATHHYSPLFRVCIRLLSASSRYLLGFLSPSRFSFPPFAVPDYEYRWKWLQGLFSGAAVLDIMFIHRVELNETPPTARPAYAKPRETLFPMKSLLIYSFCSFDFQPDFFLQALHSRYRVSASASIEATSTLTLLPATISNLGVSSRFTSFMRPISPSGSFELDSTFEIIVLPITSI